MASRDKERYYWLKLDRGFFKRHDIAIIEDMPNGKDYVLFYLKLMLESVDHEGALRFSDTIPYNEQMLASVTRTNVDIVRSALRMFEELGMVEVFDDKTMFMTEVAKLLGSETYAAKRKREQRKFDDVGDIVPRLSPGCPQEKEIDIEIEKEIETEKDKEDISTSTTTIRGSAADADLQAVMSFYMDNISKAIPSDVTTRAIQSFIEDLGTDIVLHAMEITAEAETHDWRYCKRILERYRDSGLKTMAAVLEDEAKAKQGKAGWKQTGTKKQERPYGGGPRTEEEKAIQAKKDLQALKRMERLMEKMKNGG